MLIENKKGTNKNPNQSDDDDYEDNGSGIEDDAPEGFQALQRPEQATITFPDLLRVPTTTANMSSEDDSPESLSFASGVGQPVRPNDLQMSASTTGQRQSSNTLGEPIGGLPRNRRPLSHPDVSQMNLSSTPSTSLPSSSSSIPFEPTARPLPPLPASDESGDTSNQMPPPLVPRNPISNFNASHDSPSPLSPQTLAPILGAISRIQSSVETLSRQFNERLDVMENRINEITSNNVLDNLDNLNQVTPEFLRNFIQEQKREMHNQRRSFVLSFAEALRFAADPPHQNGSAEPPNSSNNNRSRSS